MGVSTDCCRKRTLAALNRGDEPKTRRFNWPVRGYIKLDEKERMSGRLKLIREALYVMAEYPLLP